MAYVNARNDVNGWKLMELEVRWNVFISRADRMSYISIAN